MNNTIDELNETPGVILTESQNGWYSLRYSERKLLLGLIDIILLLFGLAVLLERRTQGSDPLIASPSQYFLWGAILVGIWCLVAPVFGLYDLKRASDALASMWAAVGTVFIVTTIYSLVPLITPGLPIRRLLVFLFPVISSFAISLWRLFYAKFLVQPVFSRQAIIVGAGKSARSLLEDVLKGDEGSATGYKILGFVDDDSSKHGEMIHNVPVLGGSDKLNQLVLALQPDEIILAITHTHQIRKEVSEGLLDSWEMGVQITPLTDKYEQLTGKVPVSHIGQNWHAVLPGERSALHAIHLGIRRLMDIGIALAGCIVLAILTPCVWLANRLTDPGDIFYRQERVGLGGKSFDVIKFRSMVMDAEKFSGAVWADEDDPRITKIGRFLRKTRLDEFPQFWNVMRGEMSIIGPRPERPHFVEQLAEEIPFYRARHAVKPGITGWAQVSYRYGASVEDSLHKLEYDLYYIKHQSFYLDFLIIVKTFQVMFGMKGR